MKKIVLLIALITQCLTAQTIQGHFPNFPNSNYELKGYEGVQQKTLSKATSKDDGKFILSYPKEYKGVAQLWMNGAYQVLLFLNLKKLRNLPPIERPPAFDIEYRSSELKTKWVIIFFSNPAFLPYPTTYASPSRYTKNRQL